jgi:hypothetical protein
VREGCLGQRLKGEPLSIGQPTVGLGAGTDFLADDEGADRVAVLVGAKVERFELEAGQRALGLVVAFLDGDNADRLAGHAGATANLKLTFHLDHSAGADHSASATPGRALPVRNLPRRPSRPAFSLREV